MKGVADKDETIVGIPLIVGIRPIVVEPRLPVVTLRVKDVRVAIVVEMYNVPSIPPLVEYSPS